MGSTTIFLCLLGVASAWEPEPYGRPQPAPGHDRRGPDFHEGGRGFDARSQTFDSSSGHSSSYGFDGPHSHVHVSTGFHDNHVGRDDFRDGPDHSDGPGYGNDGPGHHFGPGPDIDGPGHNFGSGPDSDGPEHHFGLGHNYGSRPGVHYAPKPIVKEVEVPRVIYKEVPKYIVKEVPRYITKEVEKIVIKEIPKTIIKEVEVPRIVVKEVPVTKTVVRERQVPKVVYKDVEVEHIVVRKIPKTIFKNVEVPHVQVNHVPVHHEVNIATPVVDVHRHLHVDDTPPITTFNTPYPTTALGVAPSTPAISVGGSLIAPLPEPVVPATPARAVYGPGKVVGSLTQGGYTGGLLTGTGLTGTHISTAGYDTSVLDVDSGLQPTTNFHSYVDKK